MEKQHYVPGELLEPATIRMGQVFKKVLPVFTQAYENNEWITVGEVERRIPVVTAGARLAVYRMCSLYVPSDPQQGSEYNEYAELLMSDYHASKTWLSKDHLELPVNIFLLSTQGYRWARFAVDSLVLAGNRRFNNKIITRDLKRLPNL